MKSLIQLLALILVILIDNAYSKVDHLKKGNILCTTKNSYVTMFPQRSSRKVAYIKKNTPLKILHEKNNWIKVSGYKYNKFSGWIHKSMLTDKSLCIVVKKTFNLGCDKKLKRVFQLHESFQVIKKSDRCITVKGPGKNFYKIKTKDTWPRLHKGA